MNIESEVTPLEKKLDSIALGLGLILKAIAFLTYIAIFTSTLIITIKDDEKKFDLSFFISISNGVTIAMTIFAVAITENGLPTVVVFSIANSVGMMFEENNFVRKLSSV